VAKSTDPIVQHAAAQTVVQNATDSLMPFLDQAVVQFTLEANDRIIWLHHAQQLVVLLLLVTLAVEAMLIFRPALRLIHAHAGNLLPARLSERAAGVVNRAAYLEHGARILAGAHRSGQPMALMMLTIDHIKRINDTYGYAVGNAVLQKFGEMLAARLPPDTVIGRIRGEEFSIILPDTDAVQAAVIAGRINRLATELRVEDPADLRCTASIGVTVLAPEAGRFDLLMREADQALNIAREAGHNRFVVHQPVEDHAQSAGRAEIA
jgi:diguanylate cyclase (GGDEF)-like protein